VLGNRDDAASRLVGALSTDSPSTEPNDIPRDDVDRYRAVVSALLDVRPDHVGGYFDEALDAALAANRVDVHLARTLRWWQRASVRAAEDFVAQVIPTVMAALDDADISAERDAAANATAWLQAQAIADLAAVSPSASASESADDVSASDDAGDMSDGDIAGGVSDGESADVTWKPAVRLVAVPDLPSKPVRPVRPATAVTPAKRSTRVRAVRLPDFDAPVADVSIDEIDSMLTFEREEPRRHAHPASSA
jgi:hypothetical protein